MPIISDIKSWLDRGNTADTHDSAFLESADDSFRGIMDKYSAKVRMILGTLVLSSAAYLWGAVHSQYETTSLVNDISSKIVRSLGKKSALDTYNEAQKEVLVLQGEKRDQKMLTDKEVQTAEAMTDSWKQKYEWAVKESSMDKVRIAKLDSAVREIRKSLSLKSLETRKDRTEIARLKQENIALTKRLAMLESSMKSVNASSGIQPAEDLPAKEEKKTSPLEKKELPSNVNVVILPDSPVNKPEPENYIFPWWGIPILDEKLSGVISPLESSDKNNMTTDDQSVQKENSPPVRVWGFLQQNSPGGADILVGIPGQQKPSPSKTDWSIVSDLEKPAIIQKKEIRVPEKKRKSLSGEYKEEWQRTSRMRAEFATSPTSKQRNTDLAEPNENTVLASEDMMKSKKESSEWRFLTVRTNKNNTDKKADSFIKKEGLSTKAENKNFRKIADISYKQIKKLTQDAQEKLNIPGMEVRVQEVSRDKFKVWVSYNGNDSRSFFTTTKKHGNRLTREGMESWVQETMNYLSCLDTIRYAAKKESIYLKGDSEAKNLKKDDVLLRVKEVGTWKIQLAFHNTAGAKEVFLIPWNILDEDTLDAIFKITKLKLQLA